MPFPAYDLRGLGWWYDRVRRRWLEIYDHTIDAAEHPERFRLSRAKMDALLAGRSPTLEETRDTVIPAMCRNGFIRVRWIPRQANLGWQFVGDPQAAYRILVRFVARKGIGPATVVTFTDFDDPGACFTCLYQDLRQNLLSRPVKTSKGKKTRS